MIQLNLSVKKFYICLAVLGMASNAFAAEYKIAPSAKKATIETKNSQAQTDNIANHTSKPVLILNTKDIFQNSVQPMGPRTGGGSGGNSCSLSISQNTRKLVDLLSTEDFSYLSNLSQLIPAIKSARFYIKDALIKDGETKDAMNYPDDKTIFVTPHFCSTELVEVSGRSMSLLLHEYLGLARIDDRKYQISGKFLETYASGANDQIATKAFLENELKKDLNGEKSCFNGAIKKQDTEELGDRVIYSSDSLKIQLEEVGFQGPAWSDGHCTRFLDKQGHEVDSEKAAYKVCDAHWDKSYMVIIPFEWVYRGRMGTDKLFFKVVRGESAKTMLKADTKYPASTSEIIHQSSQISYECTPLSVDFDQH